MRIPAVSCRSTNIYSPMALAILTALAVLGALLAAPPAAQARERFRMPGNEIEEKKPRVRLYIEPVIYSNGSTSTEEQDIEITEYSGVTVHEMENDFSHLGFGIDPLSVGIGADFFITDAFFIGPLISYGGNSRESKSGTDGGRDKVETSVYNAMIQAGGLFSMGRMVKGSVRGGVGYYGRSDNDKSYSSSGTLQIDDEYTESALTWNVAAMVHFMLVPQASLDLGLRYFNIAAHDIEINWKEDDTKFSHETDALSAFSVIGGLSIFL